MSINIWFRSCRKRHQIEKLEAKENKTLLCDSRRIHQMQYLKYYVVKGGNERNMIDIWNKNSYHLSYTEWLHLKTPWFTFGERNLHPNSYYRKLPNAMEQSLSVSSPNFKAWRKSVIWLQMLVSSRFHLSSALLPRNNQEDTVPYSHLL